MITELHIPASGSTPAGSLHAFFPVILRFFNSLWDPEVSTTSFLSAIITVLTRSPIVQEAVRQKVETLIQACLPRWTS
jgi:hypothetical protein